MKFGLMAIIVAGMAIVLVRGGQPAPCPPDTVTVDAISSTGAKDLTDALNCTGPGVVHVAVHGRLQIEQRIEISDQKNVVIKGSADNALDSMIDAYSYAEIDAGHKSGIFLVSNGSTLSISQLILKGGYSQNGGAVDVISSSFLYVVNSTFMNNRASSAGGANTLWP